MFICNGSCNQILDKRLEYALDSNALLVFTQRTRIVI
jgi:hypothetical protein